MKRCSRIFGFVFLVLLVVGTPMCFAQTFFLPREKNPEIPLDINPEAKKIIEMLYTKNLWGALDMMIRHRKIAASIVPFALDRLRDVDPKMKKSYFDTLHGNNPGQDIAKKISVIGAAAVPSLMKALHDEDPYVRAGAAFTLYLTYSFGHSNLNNISADMIPILKDTNAQVRQNTAYALGVMKNERAVGPLIEILQDESKDVRVAVVSALGKFGPAATKLLMESLNNKDALFRANVAKALGQGGDQSSVEFLCALLKDDDTTVLNEVTRALGFLRNKQAVEPLLTVLKSGNPAARSGAAWALGKIGDKRAAEPLLDALKDTAIQGRSSIALALGEIGDARAVPVLIETIHDEDENMRYGSVRALGQIKDSRAVDPLIAALGDESSQTRVSAVESLANIGDPKAIQPIIDRLADGLMWSAAKFVVKFGEPAVKPLIAVLSNENVNARERAAWILGEIGNQQAIDPLILALKDNSENVQRTVIECLGKYKDAKAIVPLIEVFGTGNLALQERAMDALVQIGTPSTSSLVDALKSNNPDVRKYSAKTLGMIRTPYAVEPLIELLDDGNQDVRKEVVRALGKITEIGQSDKEKWLKTWPEIKERCFKRWEDDQKKQTAH